jgi:hypothetical protein
MGTAIGSSIIKYDASGNELWRKNLSGELWINGITLSGTNLYITGRFKDTIQIGYNSLFSNENGDLFIAAFTSNGSTVWAKRFGGNGFDFGNSIAADKEGNLFVTGACSNGATFGNTTHSFSDYHRTFVMKADTNGTISFSKVFGSIYSTGHSFGKRIQIGQNGNIILLGSMSYDILLDTIYFSPRVYPDDFLCSLDTAGTIQWAKRVGGYGCERPDFDVDYEGNIFLTGGCEGNHGSGYTIFNKFNNSGQLQWSKSILHQSIGYSYSDAITTEKDHSYMTINNLNCPSFGFCQPPQFFIAKNDSSGSTMFLDSIHVMGLNPGFIYHSKIIPFSKGEFLACGTMNGTMQFGSSSLSTSAKKVFIAKFTEKALVPVYEVNYADKFVVAPNPSSGSVSIEFPDHNDTKITVNDILGNCLFNKDCKNELSTLIDLSTQAKGIYFLEIVSGNEKVVKKIVIQ